MMDVDPRRFEQIAVNDEDINNIVVSYLVHNCFDETAESFCASLKMKPLPYNLDDLKKRKEVLRFILVGNVPKAIELTQELAPNLLEKNKDLHFDLSILHFVELVCSKKFSEALKFAQTILSPFREIQKYAPKLEDSIALLIYKEPQNSPMIHLLSPGHREQHDNLSGYPAMERLLQQATLVRQCLTQERGADLYPPLSLKDFVNSWAGN